MTRQEEIRDRLGGRIFELITRGEPSLKEDMEHALIQVDKILNDLHSQDVAIKIEGELPSIFGVENNVIDAMEYKKKLEGYTKWEPLI